MVSDILGAESRVFPQIRVCFRSSAPRIVSARVQAVLLVTLLAGVSALAYLGISRFGYEHLVAKKEAAAAGAEYAERDLETRIDALRQALAVLRQDRDAARGRAAASADEAARLRAGLAASEKTQAAEAAQTRQALAEEHARRAALAAELDKVEAARTAEEAALAQDKATLEQTANALVELSAAHGRAKPPPGRLRARIAEIWRRLSAVRLPLPSGAATAVAEATPAPAASAGGVATGPGGPADVATVERALRSAGVDLTRVAAQVAATPAQGGPFVPPPRDDDGNRDALTRDKLAALAALGRSLPVAAPLTQYTLGSRFGPRTDPFNHRPAFHTGLDLDAPSLSPVYATAPGTVIYAGWLDAYGETVEIDHGFGIVTLYAHLRRALVAVGEHVAEQAEIGLLGTTGRSTGPHVHYEVRVDGQPQDPEKFLDLARLVPVMATAAGPLSRAATAPAENSR
jgi:murein DD-endopeptidase MepM/ murein hydrolase activator NlpD